MHQSCLHANQLHHQRPNKFASFALPNVEEPHSLRWDVVRWDVVRWDVARWDVVRWEDLSWPDCSSWRIHQYSRDFQVSLFAPSLR